ncbi:metalloendopeptidase OMA1, mitochondrial-like isoform X2 [Dreissena polymorpha]|uniref:Metalloendopeptidase OMA1, mitochondrial n=1 Tax=Dreissena polymorpha TaxID=45954 RepID=A0A9D4M2P7_DREPO|nr:metalloendopeptidase OMA1, mitochondrial-like isoform X2 [Dreissena polymorpha]KAH3867356.1 hypothetical protein DPMN_030483 [Dreissena polymorpha]
MARLLQLSKGLTCHQLKILSRHQNPISCSIKVKCDALKHVRHLQTRLLQSKIIRTNGGHAQLIQCPPSLCILRNIHITSATRAPWFLPLLPLFKGFLLKVTAVLTGRRFRQWRMKQPPEMQAKILRYKIAVFAILGIVLGSLSLLFYETHLQEAPLTGRKRFITLLPEQVKKIADFNTEMMMENLQGKILPESDGRYKLVDTVLRRLQKSNADFPGINDIPWKIRIVDANEVNAFVYPNGAIFVMTGLLNFVHNEDEFAIVLGHELSHALMSHTAEELSMVQLWDWFVFVLLAAIWCILPNDGLALVAHWYYERVIDVGFQKPFSRDIEREADYAGLYLASRACYDVRESAVLWSNMQVFEDMAGEKRTAEFLSTHPSHDSRVKYFQELIPKAVEERVKCHCPPLPAEDPRLRAAMVRRISNEVLVSRATNANVNAIQRTKHTAKYVPTYRPAPK